MRFYNSKSEEIEHFSPRIDKEVTIYVCGISPNNAAHLGHAFTYVSFDVLIRYLRYKGLKVTYVQNVTDINDDIVDLEKIEKESKDTKRSWRQIADFWTEKYLTDMKALNVKDPTYYIYATDTIDRIIEMISVLLEKKLAYEKNGNVYFDTTKYSGYGELSKYNDTLMKVFSSDRGNNLQDPLKKHPLDFVLWFNRTGCTPVWTSPWSEGVPGWHIECSAMINQYLGPQIDIHGGGRDLVFPHHENERAQSESYTGKKPFVKYWMHIGTVMYGGEKMAKSLGNLVVLSDLLKKYSANTIRWYLLEHRYRKPWEYNEKELHTSESAFEYIYKALSLSPGKGEEISDVHYSERIEHTLSHDLNTPETLYYIECLGKRIHDEYEKNNISRLQIALKKYLILLGFTV